LKIKKPAIVTRVSMIAKPIETNRQSIGNATMHVKLQWMEFTAKQRLTKSNYEATKYCEALRKLASISLLILQASKNHTKLLHKAYITVD